MLQQLEDSEPGVLDAQSLPEEFRILGHESRSELISYYAYQELSHALQEYYAGLDAEMILVTLSLFLISLLVLSPRGSFRGLSLQRRRFNIDCQAWHEYQEHMDGEEGLSSNRTTSTNNSTYADEEDSDEEKFEKMWPTILASGYRLLVLPPECKLVQGTSLSKQQKDEQRKTATSNNRDAEITDDDHPITRLKRYSEQILHLLRNFLSYEYTKAGQMIINWIQYWLRLKQRKTEEAVLEEEEDDDAVALPPRKLSGELELASHAPEADLVRQASDASDSYHSVSGGDDDEHDVGPLSPTRQRSLGKKKDALASYRTPSGPLTPQQVRLSARPASPEMMTPRQDEDETLPLTRAQKFSGSLTFFDAAHSKASLRRLHVEVPVPDR
jgi:hypothetical protein